MRFSCDGEEAPLEAFGANSNIIDLQTEQGARPITCRNPAYATCSIHVAAVFCCASCLHTHTPPLAWSSWSS